MSRQKRDYRLEYARRVERGLKAGLTRSQARGHARHGEKPKAEKAHVHLERDQAAVKMMKQGVSLTDASRANRISPERLRRYLLENTRATYAKRRWTIEDHRSFRFPFYSRRRVVRPWLPAAEASEAGRYMSAVRRALRDGEPWRLIPFRGEGATDTKGKFYPFECGDLNTLHGLDMAGEASIPETYRIQGAASHG